MNAISNEQYQLLRADEDARHRDAIKELRRRNFEYQQTCSHPSEHVHYFPDASGNNDSWYECGCCGKQW